MTPEYPLLLKRIQALLIDLMLLLVSMLFITKLIELLNGVPDGVRMGAFIVLFFLYDPCMTSIFGGTLGHLSLGIRVKKASAEGDNINFFAALLRFVIKSLLGWISLLTITGNSRKRAIHDMLSGSVVTFRKSHNAQPVASDQL